MKGLAIAAVAILGGVILACLARQALYAFGITW